MENCAIARPVDCAILRGLTLPTAHAGGCSGDVCGSPLRARLTGLPGPQNVQRRVLVAVEPQSTAGTDMGTNGERLLYSFPTPATVLGGVLCRQRYHSLPGACCLESEDGTECCPARIADAFGEVTVPHHVGDLHIFQIDHVILAYQSERCLVVEVVSLAPYALMFLRQLRYGLTGAFAPVFRRDTRRCALASCFSAFR